MRILTVQSKKSFFVVKVIVYVLRIIGLAPFSIVTESSARIDPFVPNVKAFRSSKFGLAYNVLLGVGITAVGLFVLPLYFERLQDTIPSGRMDPVTQFLSYVNYFLRVAAFGIVAIYWGLMQNTAASVMNQLLSIDIGLCAFEKQLLNKRHLIFLIIHVFVHVIGWSNACFTRMIYSVMDYQDWILYLPSEISDLVLFWFLMEYAAVVSLVANEIGTVNTYLTNFEEIHDDFFPRRSQSRVAEKKIANETALRKMLHYHYIRTRLYDVCDEIEEFFSLPILFSMSYYFFTFFNTLFSISRANVTGSNSDSGIIETASNAIVVVFQFVYPVTFLALSVTRLEETAQETTRVIDKLLEVTVKEEFVSELQLFSKQILNEDVCFTAYGFFTLNCRFLLSMLGGVVTYFAILIQFPYETASPGSNSTNVTTV